MERLVIWGLMVPSSPNPDRLRAMTLWPNSLQVTPVQLQGEELLLFQEDKSFEGSRFIN